MGLSGVCRTSTVADCSGKFESEVPRMRWRGPAITGSAASGVPFLKGSFGQTDCRNA